MKFIIALAATALAANALDLEETYPDVTKSFSIGAHHKVADYASGAYLEELPGADFNRQVYSFDTENMIWDQQDYNERVKVEAEILVALEALKTSVSYLHFDIDSINLRISANAGRIGAN